MQKLDFAFENNLRSKGLKFIGGVDEVGRGSIAGPLVAACVVFGRGVILPEDIVVRDSKKMTKNQRQKASVWIKENALSWGVGEVSVDTINKKGIVNAVTSGFYRSVKEVEVSIKGRLDYLLIDGKNIPKIREIAHIEQNAIPGADAKIFSVSAASIIAKVYRDNLMKKLGFLQEFAVYKWDKNKGYGTAEHKEALISHGITPHHRTQFVESFLKEPRRKK